MSLCLFCQPLRICWQPQQMRRLYPFLIVAPRFTPEHGSIMIHHFTVDPDGDDNLPEEEANDGEPIETDAAID